MKPAASVHHWPWQPLMAGLLCAGVGFVAGGVPWQDEIDALQHLQQQVSALHSRLAAIPLTLAPNAADADRRDGAQNDPLNDTLHGPKKAPAWLDVRQAASFWPELQQGLKAQGLQLQALKPGPQEVLAGGLTQTVLLDLQGDWDDWRLFEQQLDRHVPGWAMSRWQVTPLQAGANGPGDAGQVRMQWHVQWAWREVEMAGPAQGAAQTGAPPRGGEWLGLVAVSAPVRTASLFAEPGRVARPQSIVQSNAQSNAQSVATPEWVGPVEQWPVQALRFQGVWQQAGVLHAVLGSGLQQVVVVPGQAVGREAYRVLHVGADEVVLQPPHATQAPLRLGWSGGGK